MPRPNKPGPKIRADYEARMHASGFRRLQLWVHEDDREKVIDLTTDLRDLHPRVDPEPEGGPV